MFLFIFKKFLYFFWQPFGGKEGKKESTSNSTGNGEDFSVIFVFLLVSNFLYSSVFLEFLYS